MELFNSAGLNVTKSPMLLVTKGIGALIVSASIQIEDFTTEQISFEIERKSGNKQVTNGTMSLADFIMLTTFNADAVTSDANYKVTAECEVAEDGAIWLDEKDVIKIQLTGLKTANTYVLNGIEMPQFTEKILQFENKSMSSDEKSKTFDIYDCDLALLDNSNDIEEVLYTFLNDVVVTYTMHELRVLSRSVDPVAYVKQDGTVKSAFTSKLQLPLFGVKSIQIRKTQGNIINLLTRIEA